MKTMWKDAGILFVITLMAGLMLGSVYQITKEPIAYQEALALEKACEEVFAGADNFIQLETFREEEAKLALENGGYQAQSVDGCMVAMDASGKELGYVITVTTHEGYGGDIQFTMGITRDGQLNGISLLAISETPGLGMRAEEVLAPQFVSKKVSCFTYVKGGAAKEEEIDAISGATITTNALTEGVNAGLYYFQTQLLTKTASAANNMAEEGVGDAF